uniref:CCHC-type domain-containing protein n=1 Tax=Ananas comosus var. bracteatus TaxID=296719 RepID=A0A6V7NIW2_ANACO|nr:unnamed protein product [Ananas comosus var. bracteatus]
MIDDNIVGIGEGVGEGVDEGVGEGVGEGVDEGVGEGVDEGVGEGVGEGAGEGVGEDIGGAIGENVGQVAEEAVDEDIGENIGENIGEAYGEDVGQVAKEPVDESDAMLSEDSFRSLKTDDSDLEDNMDHVGTFSYDVNNPIMEVGAKYPNVGSFRDALTHFALLNEFEYNLQKSDLLRVTATCAKSNCKWRIHASRLQNSLVFQIKTLQGEHTCTSANRCRNKVATQSWVCNRVIEWLRLEGDLSTTELRKRLQQKYHCDYLTNNISESFNAWISNDRHRPLIDMLDTIRQKIMVKMEDRRNRARKWDHEIVPTVLKYVNNISKGLGQYEVLWSDEFSAEVIGPQSRFEVRLHETQCSCRLWQVKVAKYKEAYASSIAPLPSCDQWVKIDIGHRVLPPILNRPAGRPRNKRIRGSDEMTIRKRHRCKRCNKLGHRAKTCKNPVDANQQPAAGPSQAANQQPAAAPSQATNQQPTEPSQAGNPHSEPPSQASISSCTRRRGKRVVSRSKHLQSQQGSVISEIDALGSLEN